MIIPNFVKAAIFAAIIVGTSNYLATNANPLVAGFLCSIPVALTSMIFLDTSKRKTEDFAWTFCIGNVTYGIIATIFYYLYTFKGFTQKNAVMCSMGLWFVLVTTAFFFISDKGPHRK